MCMFPGAICKQKHLQTCLSERVCVDACAYVCEAACHVSVIHVYVIVRLVCISSSVVCVCESFLSVCVCMCVCEVQWQLAQSQVV